MSTPEYQILDLLGAGAYGSVYLGRRVDLGDESPLLAIKIVRLPTKKADADKQVALLDNEIMAVRALSATPDCSNYVACYIDHFRAKWEDLDSYFIVQKYIQGPSLDKIIERTTEPIHIDKLWDMFISLVQGLYYIHSRGFAHKDIKPANIVYDELTDSFVYIDFGFGCSKFIPCQPGLGTLNYMPVESFSDDSSIQRALKVAQSGDIWSLGIVLYQLANLSRPYQDPVFNTVAADNKRSSSYTGNASDLYLPRSVDFIVNWMMSTVWYDRPTVSILLQYLEEDKLGCTIDGQIYHRPQLLASLDPIYEYQAPLKMGRFSVAPKRYKGYNQNDFLSSLCRYYYSKLYTTSTRRVIV